MVTWGARSAIVAGQNLAPGGQYLSSVITNNSESSEVFASMGARGIIEILREIDGELLEATLVAKLVESPNGQWVGAAIVMGAGYSRFRVRVTNLGDASTTLDLDYAQSAASAAGGGSSNAGVETRLDQIITNTASNKLEPVLLEDSTGAVFIATIDVSNNTVTNRTLAGANYTPVPPVTIASPDRELITQAAIFEATTTSAGNWSIGQQLRRIEVINATTNALASTIWINDATGGILATAPVIGTDCNPAADVLLDIVRSGFTELTATPTTASPTGTIPEQLRYIGENVGGAPKTPIDVRILSPLQTTIPAGFTLPAVGATVAVTVASGVGFIVGDIVAAAEVRTQQDSARVAWLEVTAAAGNNLTLRHVARTGGAAAGAVFAAGATELTGQTLLPTVAGAGSAIVSISLNAATVAAAANTADPANAMAVELTSGTALLLFGLALAGTPQLDGVERVGMALGDDTSIELQNPVELAAARLFAWTNIRFAAQLEATYYG